MGDELKPCPWGCIPVWGKESVPAKEDQFPDRQRLIVSCEHAKMKGEVRLVCGEQEAIDLAAKWNTRTETQSQATIDELVAERKAIIEHIPMDYLERHGVGASAPADAEKLKRAMRDYAEDRWKLLDRLKDAIAKAGGQS